MSRKSAGKATIRRAKHTRKFVVVGNVLAQSSDISYEALGLLVHLLSRPDDWTVVLSTLQRDGCRKDKLARIVAELIDLGYIERVQLRSSGRFGGFDYVVSEVPSPQTEKPSPVKPSPVKPSPVNPPLQRTDSDSLPKTEETKKQTTTTKARSLSLEILGKDDLDKFDRLKSVDRVDLVCFHAQSKDSPNGWAVSALNGDWKLDKPKAVPVVSTSFDLFNNWKNELICVGLTIGQANRFTDLFHEDVYLFENDRSMYDSVRVEDLLSRLDVVKE